MPGATLDQIAHLLKITPRMVNIHVKQNGMPRLSRGEYDLVKCVHWYLDYKDRLLVEARKGNETEQQARARLIRASADLRELELARERGQLVPVETIKYLWERVVVAFKTRMLAIPSKLPQRLIVTRDVNEVKGILDSEIFEALNELSAANVDVSEYRRYEKARSVDDAADEPPAKADRKRLGRQKPGAEPGIKRRAGTVAD